MKKLLLLMLAISFFALPALAQEDTVVEEIVARVNNSIITRADLKRSHDQMMQELREQNPNVSSSEVAEREKYALRDLIDQQLLIQKANDLGISADVDVVKRLDDLRRQMGAKDMDELQKMAEQQGVSWEDFKNNTKNGILTQRVISQEVGGKVNITHDEAMKFYEEHKSEFDQPESVRLSEILVSNTPNQPAPDPKTAKDMAPAPTADQIAAAKARAEELLQQLKSGQKFEDIARKFSNGPTAEQGGDLGYFKRGMLAKELEDKTFPLKPGETSDVIQTKQGFVILKVTDHTEAGLPPFNKVQPQIQEAIYVKKIQPALREYLTKLREDAYIDIKPGYVDAGASPNQTKLVYTSASDPKAKGKDAKSRKHKRFLLF